MTKIPEINPIKKVAKKYPLDDEFRVKLSKDQLDMILNLFKKKEIQDSILDYEDEILVLKPGAGRRTWQKVWQKIKNPQYYLVQSGEGCYDSHWTEFRIEVEGNVKKSNSEIEEETRLLEKKLKEQEKQQEKQKSKELAELRRLQRKYKDKV